MGAISTIEPDTENTTTTVSPKVIKNQKNVAKVEAEAPAVTETPVVVEAKTESNSTRLLVFDKIIENFKFTIHVPEENWSAAEQIAYDFNSSFENTFVADDEDVEKKNTLNGFWIYVNFMEFATRFQADNKTLLTKKDVNRLLINLFIDFSTRFLKGNDIHIRTRHFEHEYRIQVIQHFYTVFDYLQKDEESARAIANFLPVEPALAKAVRAGDALALAVFGGQGYPGFNEILQAYNIYGAIVRDYIAELSTVLKDLAAKPEFERTYKQGLDILKWLRNPESLPEDAYLDSAPVSFPLIGIVQLVQYLILFRTFRKTPDWARRLFAGTTGHSQGLVTSVVIASSGTEEEYMENSKKAVSLLFLIGARSQQIFAITPLSPETLQEIADNGDENDMPTCMLSINGLPEATVRQTVNELNRYIEEPAHKVTISLINGLRMIVVTGAPESLQNLKMTLKKIQAAPNEDQSRIPFSKRKQVFTMKFLSVTIPAHNEILKEAAELVCEDAAKLNITFPTKDLAIPVYRTDNGVDMKEESDVTDVVESVVNQICILPVDWVKATNVPGLTHVLDFGPGGASGIGSLIQKNKEGTGVQVILSGTIASTNPDLKCKMYAYTTEVEDLPYGINWAKEFAPKLIRNADGELLMDTRYTRLTGRPPLLVGGMTPTTANPQFVSAVINAGYNVEVGCGALYAPHVLDQCIKDIVEKIPDGEGILCNIVFLNQRLWAFQFPAVLDMRKNRGIRIEGITIAAGVPSLDYCKKMIPQLIDAGIPYIGFKPGNRDAILKVIQIARTFPEMPMVVEWTGGRSGGHHSCEDFYAPILETYAALRKQSNIVVVVGSGFGDDVETLPFITGDWSIELGYPPMPFDGLLVGSRVCVAKEALTSDGIKEVIVNTPGIEDQSQWEKSYDRPVGGVVTVESEYGEPIHKIATRGVMFWKELDKTIFSIHDPKKRLEKLLEKKDYVIEHLNKDFQKVWFGQKNGKPCDIEEMTYEEVILRLIELLFVQKRKQWLDVSHLKTTADFIYRTEERFVKDSNKETFLSSPDDLKVEDPVALMKEFFDTRAPGARTELVATEDVQYFIGLTRNKDRKPPPFICVLDEEFHVWLKRDSLWQAEDLDAVVDQDPQRVAILQGPVAIRHSKIANEPVKEILDGIIKSHIKSIEARYYANRAVPDVEYLGGTPIPATVANVPANVKVEKEGTTMIYTLPAQEEQLPEDKEWIEFMAGPKYGWLRALLCTPTIARNKSITHNRFKRVFKPRTSQIVKIFHNEAGDITKIEIYGWNRSMELPALEAEIDDQRVITVGLREWGVPGVAGAEVMKLLFRYTPDQGSTPIHEVMEGRNKRIAEFYYNLWYGPEDSGDGWGDLTSIYKCKKRVTEEDVKFFSDVTRYTHPSNKVVPSMDFIIVTSWVSVFKTIFAKEFDADITRLVHMNNGYEVIDPRPLQVGELVDTRSIISAVTNLDSGKLIEVTGHVFREGKEYVKVTSSFLCRGKFDDYHMTFNIRDEPEYILEVKDEKILNALMTRKYISFTEPEKIQLGVKLVFRLKTEKRFATKTTYSSITTKGKIYINNSAVHGFQMEEVGQFNYDSTTDEKLEGKEETLGNPAIEFVKKYAKANDRKIYFENGGYNILPKGVTLLQRAPNTNEDYSLASGDVNPIHTNYYFANLADLDVPITHGMWTSAATRRYVETYAADNDAERVVSYKVNFIGMVSPKDELRTTLTHVGMHNGRKIIKVSVKDLRTNETVMEGEAEVKQKPTAYVFTGQGAQEVGMGQELYNKSAVAKAVWDRADAYLMKKYGYSILEIVRTNPKSLTVYFGGEEGEKIRENYINMTCEIIDSNGKVQTKRMFPEIDENTLYYEYKSPTGLLNATQFTQPAITLTEKAAFEDMLENGYICDDAVYAGHSLGEYAALSCVANTLSIESMAEIVFYRGLVMQSSVERDELNRSDYAMCAVNPVRVHPYFSYDLLVEVVKKINSEHGGLLEIVNYNVEDYQYVVTGDLTSLEALKNLLTNLRAESKKFITLYKEDASQAMDLLNEKVVSYVKMAEERKAKEGFFNIERGAATIPLRGIDVPFHSSYLLWGVPTFRELLHQRVRREDVDVKCLVGRYIPNLMGEPFSVEKDYAIRLQKRTNSAYLEKIIEEWDEHLFEIPYIIMVELLAYQLASAVQWIKTQEFLFSSKKKGGADVERLIEFGPTPTLVGMAKRTLGKNYAKSDLALGKKRQLLAYAKNTAEIYYEFDDMDFEEEEASAPVEEAPKAAAPTPAPAPVPVAAVPVAAPAGPAASVADAPVSATEILRAILAQKLKKSISEVPLNKSIKELSGGRSTIQNEVSGDLHTEFGGNSIPLKAEELALEELGKQISSTFNGQLGKYTTQMINRMLSGKMPAGFSASAVKTYLANSYGLGKGRTDGVLLVAITMEPSSRLGSEADAQAWLDSVVSAYSSASGVAISKGSAAPAPAAVAAPVMPVAMPVAAAAGPAAAVADAPISPNEIIRVMLAQKLKKSLNDIPMSKSIKELSGGRSTVQNEVSGDLHTEFGGNSIPLKAEELAITELGGAIGANHNGKLGKYTSTMVNRMLSGKMPAGFSASKAKDYLKSSYGLGDRRTDAVLLYSTTMEPASRLGSEADAQAWLDKAVDLYSGANSLGLAKGGAGGAVAAAVPGVAAMGMVNSAEVTALKMKQDSLIRTQLENYAKYLGIDLREDQKKLVASAESTAKLQSDLDLWFEEHGEDYANGIKPMFSSKKARTYDSSWNWGYQDFWFMVYDILAGEKKDADALIASETFQTMVNRANASLLQQVEFVHRKVVADQKDAAIKATLEKVTGALLEAIKTASGKPIFKFNGPFNAPHALVDEQGQMIYKEIPRKGIQTSVDYVKEMEEGAMQTIGSTTKKVPFLFIRDQAANGVDNVDEAMSKVYLNELKKIAEEGISFAGKHVLITGCGRNSIGECVLKYLLAGGAKVVATTSSYRRATMEHFRSVYEQVGTKGSTLVVVPFNQGSKKDVNDLVEFIYSKDSRVNGLGWDLDLVIPFAAISENGRDISDLDGKSELAHRIMMTNVIRILGAIRTQKMKVRSLVSAQVILPLSPNHGTFGGDGLYGESKIGLENLLNRWRSETWSKYLSITGACIGWTRGTGLMNSNNLISEGIESQGTCRTFSTTEMAFNLIGLVSDVMVSLSRKNPIYADLNGGMQYMADMNVALRHIREKMTDESEKKKLVIDEDKAHADIVGANKVEKKRTVEPRSNIRIEFPELKSREELKDMEYLRDLLDLDRVVVVTGYGEVGPYGNTRTRWEMEAEGKFSLEGCVELAWIMGFIKHVTYKQMPDGTLYSGWVDAKSGAPIKDIDIKATYEKDILAHTGIRLIEPELFNGYNPEKKKFLQEVMVDTDLPPFEASKEEAETFKRQHEDNVEIYEVGDGRYMVRILKGASIYVAKALQFDRLVSGQLPTGWDPARYGIPKDIIEQVDPITCYCIVSAVEALVSAGITDPYEFYEYVHVSEVGNACGSGVGAEIANRAIFKDRFLDKPLQSDILQETFVNTMSAWINLLLLSSSGPIRTPVGACASAVESVDIGIDTILSGKAKVVFVGGYDDFQEEGSYEFAQMKATSNSREEMAQGREPDEMSRPTASSRGGFMEAQGVGTQVLMPASLALKMGVPIYGIVAHSATATDKEGRSVPAPGQGILTTAREMGKGKSPLLNPKYRARQLNARKKWIKSWVEEELELMNEEVKDMEGESQEVIDAFIEERTAFIDAEARKQEKEAFQVWGQDFYKNDPTISPLRGALAAFGLTVDDIGVASFHGTGTKANDKNESDVFNKQFEHLGRTKGNACPVVCQKYLTGHGKGAAAAWMLNGVIQIIQTGIIPGNRNADNIDPLLEKFDHLWFNNKTFKTPGVKAGLLKSFGFGQVGGEILVVHPDCLFATLDEATYNAYKAKREIREHKAYRYLHDTLSGDDFVQVKNDPPYTPEQESAVYLNPLARASYNEKTKKWDYEQQFAKQNEKKAPSQDSQAMNLILKQMADNTVVGSENVGLASKVGNGVGVDVALISELNIENEGFVQRNFTPAEITYCQAKPDIRSSFAGKWAAKEAVIKAISSYSLEAQKIWEGAGAPLKDIEVVMAESGAPKVLLSKELNEKVKAVGVNDVKVTISHSGQFAIAMAYAN